MTHQESLHRLRESERVRLESAREECRNTTRITPAGNELAIDRAGRQVVIQHTAESLIRIIEQARIALKSFGNYESAPETLRGSVLLTDEAPAVPYSEKPDFK